MRFATSGSGGDKIAAISEFEVNGAKTIADKSTYDKPQPISAIRRLRRGTVGWKQHLGPGIPNDRVITSRSQANIEQQSIEFDPGGPVARAQEIMFKGTETSIQLARKHGLEVAWGTDMIFIPDVNVRQGYMLTLMGKFCEPWEVLKLATSNAAELRALSGPRNPFPAAPLGEI